MDRERKLLIKRINNNIGKCLIEDRITILNRIAPNIKKKDIFQEGCGIRVFYKRLDFRLLEEIYEMVNDFKTKTELDLNSGSESEED